MFKAIETGTDIIMLLVSAAIICFGTYHLIHLDELDSTGWVLWCIGGCFGILVLIGIFLFVLTLFPTKILDFMYGEASNRNIRR